ncbi:LysR family transcriptional regulator [Pseudoduganella sp. RAF19]|uniref:LysR family transcriptional regulator n=1 Tax=Pseudoduganella sp. RAF19 TaxID=3233052 RepID=UPI003F96DAD5
MTRRFDHLADVETFVTVVERGSLTAAAVALSTTPSVVSRAIARLEARLGSQLLRRTTRSMSLTEAGQLYMEQSRAAFAQIDEAERAIQGTAGAVTGRIRITAPTTFGNYRLPALLQRFTALHPGVRVDLNISNRNVDLAADGYDFAIRQGMLKDSSLIARKLEDAQLVLVCSPSYAAQAGLPDSIEALAEHRCLSFLMPSTGRAVPWQLRRDGEDIDWTPQSLVQVSDDPLGVISLAEAGLGICHGFHFVVQERLARGALVPVLPQLWGRSRPFSLLYPRQRSLSAAARAFIETLVP